MDGGGRSQRTVSTQEPAQLTPEARQLWEMVLPQVRGALEAQPLVNFTAPTPQQIAELTPEQQQAIQLGTGQLNAPMANVPELAALQELVTRVAAPIGSSPATREGIAALEREFQETTLPLIQSQLNLQGAPSGALGDALARARSGVSAATVPLLQQEAELRAGAVPELLGVGQTLEARPGTRAETAFNLSEAQRQIAQSRFDAAFQDFLRRQGITENITGGVTGQLLPAGIIPGRTVRRSTGGGGGLLGSVICTLLYQRGDIDRNTYIADQAFGATIDPAVLAGYHRWAIPFVAFLERHPRLIPLIVPLGQAWAREIAYQVGIRYEGSWLGRIILWLGLPLCAWLGRRRRVTLTAA